jgi:PilZ domain-containing protein
MQAISLPARQTRTSYRHELSTLTYVTLDEANGGIIRNLNSGGVAVQAVGPLRQEQRVRLRFELRFPRLRVDTFGQVSWASPSGRCGIRFVELPARTSHQIKEWIFASLLDAIARDSVLPHSMFVPSFVAKAHVGDAPGNNVQDETSLEEDDGLTLSAPPRPAIRLGTNVTWPDETDDLDLPIENVLASLDPEDPAQTNWLSQPLSGNTLAWMVDSLVMIAGLLLFALIFVAIAHEVPRWPLTLGAATAAAVFVAATYWTLFAIFGGSSLGARLAQATSGLDEEESDEADRFR